MNLDIIANVYDQYVDTFRDADGKLSKLMELKRFHTAKVVENATLIADGENFSERERNGAIIAALLHDTGRYEQLKRFNTFRDADSIDHAIFSHDIVREKNWLKDVQDSESILKAILYHNRKDLPDDMDPLTTILAHTVRDADKLDIFRVLENEIQHTDWRNDSRAFWNLPPDCEANPQVIAAIREHHAVDYHQIKSLADFVLIQVGWIISGLHFATTRRLTAERGHLAFRRRFLSEIGAGAAADEICVLAENYRSPEHAPRPPNEVASLR